MADIVYFEIPLGSPPTPEDQVRFERSYLRNPRGVLLSELFSGNQAKQVRDAIEAVGLDRNEIQNYMPDALVAELGVARCTESGIHGGESAETVILRGLCARKEEQQGAFASFEQQYRYAADFKLGRSVELPQERRLDI